MLLCSIVMRNIQIFCGGPVMFVFTCYVCLCNFCWYLADSNYFFNGLILFSWSRRYGEISCCWRCPAGAYWRCWYHDHENDGRAVQTRYILAFKGQYSHSEFAVKYVYNPEYSPYIGQQGVSQKIKTADVFSKLGN